MGFPLPCGPAKHWGWSAKSGCGKSVTALSVLRLVADPPGRIVGGAIRFEGKNLLDLSESEMEAVRGNDISMIFQEPMTSLNPLLTVGRQISEAIALHQGLARRPAMEQAVEMLRRVHIPEPERRAHAYPHQLSGGMRQRAMIAMALSCNPKLLDCRRADHGARRDDPGADPRPDAGIAGDARHGDDPDHP